MSISVAQRSVSVLLETLASNGELAHVERIAPRPAQVVSVESAIESLVSQYFPSITSGLWSHQASAIEAVNAGRSVVVATGTASGKSLCYQIPLASAAVQTKGQATSLLLFPTKALAQDQLRSLGSLGIKGLSPVTYDGDTSPDARQWARRHATAVLTNPDMLHAGILPYHGRWANFLKRLRFIVIDELHVYRGIFGSHLAQILRRLSRMCTYYGSNPTFVFASATIGEPAALATELCGRPVTCISNDGSPLGERHIAVWNPPPGPDGVPVSGNSATATLLAALVNDGHRAIAFCRGRRGAELVASRAKHLVDVELSDTIQPYRGGFLAEERRAIERKLFDGTLRGVATTNALELGVDIGGLDACICNGFPGTISSFRQQIGRAGRSAQSSLAVLVAGDDALDQWYAQNPRELFRRSPEPVVINVANPFVLVPHLACAAHELPLRSEEADDWDIATKPRLDAVGLDAVGLDTAGRNTAGRTGSGETEIDLTFDEILTPRLGTDDVSEAFNEGVRALVHSDQLVIVNGRAVYAGRGSPSSRVSLRSGGGSEFRIVDQRARLIGTVDGTRVFPTLHEGALYLHQGQQYRVTRLDTDDRAAWVEAVNMDEYTQSRSITDVRFVGVHTTTSVGPMALRLGTVEIHEQVVGYQRKKISTGALLSNEGLDLPPSTLVTRAFWYTVPEDLLVLAGLDGATGIRTPGTLHAVEHTAIAMLPLFTICDRWDVGGVSIAVHPDTGEATIVIYDGYPGGAGIAELGYAAGRHHLVATLEALKRCSCTDGCPSCVQSPKCGNGNEPLDKHGAISLLRAAL